ncbi:MAG: hypothetical protein OXK82_04595 [Deltaproteobacteria bacterium]|nr:hypothetical protein [Deltaproteobacteria bacterium]
MRKMVIQVVEVEDTDPYRGAVFGRDGFTYWGSPFATFDEAEAALRDAGFEEKETLLEAIGMEQDEGDSST